MCVRAHKIQLGTQRNSSCLYVAGAFKHFAYENNILIQSSCRWYQYFELTACWVINGYFHEDKSILEKINLFNKSSGSLITKEVIVDSILWKNRKFAL